MWNITGDAFFVAVDIQEVPSEMPIYLLAEDEGNEEEILRLLESESPGGSPYFQNSSPVALTEPQEVNCTTELNSVNSSSSHQEVAISRDKNCGYVIIGGTCNVVNLVLQRSFHKIYKRDFAGV